MQSYVVRIYRVREDHAEQLVGMIELDGKGPPLAFSNIDELWEILIAPSQADLLPAPTHRK